MFELGLIVAVIAGVGQVTKQFIPKKYMPLVSLVLGIVAGVGLIDGSIEKQLFIGVALGLSASGAFDISKVATKQSGTPSYKGK